jgi:hypothetical protein
MRRTKTLSPEFIEETAWAIEQVKRLVKGGLQPGEPDLTRAPNGVMVVSPSDGIAARDTETMYGELCYLYRILDSDFTDNEIALEAILDGSGNCMQQRVFNTAASAAAGDSYFLSERLRSGHRYIVPSSDDRREIWRVTFQSATNTAASTNLSSYAASEVESVPRPHPELTVDGGANTIVFNVAGNYTIGVHVSASVNSGTVSGGAKIYPNIGRFIGGVFSDTSSIESYNLPLVTIPDGSDSGDGAFTAFCESHITMSATNQFGIQIIRTGDTTTSLNIYVNITLGRVWL